MNSIEKIKKALGPCGLNCEKCFANADGGIKYHSRKLQELLGNFDDYLRKRWIEINQRIKEIGIENYYYEIKEKPRY